MLTFAYLLMLLFMRKRVFLWMSALFLFVSVSLAQDIPAGLSIAFKKGNSQELSNYLGSKVNFIIQDRSSDVNNQTAQTMMADFYLVDPGGSH
jgi:hypothetical protein